MTERKHVFLILYAGLISFLLAFILLYQSQSIQNNEKRQPGFLFIELETKEVEQYITFFKKTANFELKRKDSGFALLETTTAQLLLMSPDSLPQNHPFYGARNGSQGIGVEIGIVVKNLDQAFIAASKITSSANSGWKMSSEIMNRPWGVRDFRILTPDGYYLRFTEPNHPA